MGPGLDERALAEEVRRRHGAHTVLLYGSRARGTATPTSDVDVVALRHTGGPARDVAPWEGFALDVHVFDEAGVPKLLDERAPSFVDARVLVEEDGAGTRLCAGVKERLAKPPPALDAGEWAALWAWGEKMQGRVRASDPTVAALHRATVLVETPAVWCQVRGRWFFGAKAMLTRWERDDPAMLAAYRAAARPSAPPADLDALLARAFDRRAACRPPP